MATLSQIASFKSQAANIQAGINKARKGVANLPNQGGGGGTPSFDPLPGQPGYNTQGGTPAFGQ